MTVQELMEELKSHDPDATVMTGNPNDDKKDLEVFSIESDSDEVGKTVILYS